MSTVTKTTKGSATSQPHRHAGFTLIELMITLAVLAIIVAVALPNYSAYVLRSHRADAKMALVEIANLQEKFYSDNGSYATVLTDLPYPAVSPENYYTLALIDDGDGQTFDARASADPARGQDKDADCLTISLNHFNARTATPDAANQCWTR